MCLSLFVYWRWSQSVSSSTSDLLTCYQYHAYLSIRKQLLYSSEAAYDGSTQLLPKLKLLSDVLPPSPSLQLEASLYSPDMMVPLVFPTKSDQYSHHCAPGHHPTRNGCNFWPQLPLQILSSTAYKICALYGN